jgi:hypothetical protein
MGGVSTVSATKFRVEYESSLHVIPPPASRLPEDTVTKLDLFVTQHTTDHLLGRIHVSCNMTHLVIADAMANLVSHCADGCAPLPTELQQAEP